MQFTECKGKGSHTCMNCGKKEHSLLIDLSYEELEMLENTRILGNYDKGETIYEQGSEQLGLICLNAGKVKIVRTTEKGVEQIVGLNRPVDFLGMQSFVANTPYRESAVALEDSSICIIARDAFMTVVKQNSALAIKLIGQFATDLDTATSRLVNISHKHLRARLAECLIYIADFYGLKNDGKTINCMLKRGDLGALSNMTTANVIRTLSAFEKEGIVELNKKDIAIIHHDRLQEISVTND